MTGLAAAGAAARAFGDFFQFYHFTLVLACMGACVAASMVVTQAFCRGRAFADVRSILAAAGLGFCSGLAGGIVAQELHPDVLGNHFAIAAWGITGGFLGLIHASWLENIEPVPALCGGLGAGMTAGWLLFDPFAEFLDLAIEAGELGFLFGATIIFADGVLGRARSANG
jgi:hypothetical protein